MTDLFLVEMLTCMKHAPAAHGCPKKHATSNIHKVTVSKYLVCCCVSVVVAHLQPALALAFVQATESEAPQRTNSTIQLDRGDAELMQSLRGQIENLPENERNAKGLELLLKNVDKFKNDTLRQKVYLNIGELYKRMGDLDHAMIYFEKAGVADDDVIGAVSRERLLDSLERKALEPVIQKALELRDSATLSDDEFASLTYKAGVALIRQEKRDEAITLGIEAASQRPSVATFGMLETLANDANDPADREAYLKGMRWLSSETNSGDFGQSLRFLCNFAHAEEVAGNIDDSLKIRKAIVDRFPDEADTADQILSISRLSWARGDDETARKYLTILADGNYPEKVKRAGRSTLDSLNQQFGVKNAVEPLAARPKNTISYIVIVNVVVVVACVVLYVVRRRRAAK
jgi:tetratricopeptide (TPR) repeat protein